MKRRTISLIGILVILLVLGAAAAMAQNTSGKTTSEGTHECTPAMMENMSKNCPGQMMQSGACENMMNGTQGMMNNIRPPGTNAAGGNHCGDMGSGMGSMMGSSRTGTKGMM